MELACDMNWLRVAKFRQFLRVSRCDILATNGWKFNAGNGINGHGGCGCVCEMERIDLSKKTYNLSITYTTFASQFSDLSA